MPAQMTFKPQQNKLRELLEEIHNGYLQLPDFQRSWVWDDERIRDLIASVSQGWPAGAVPRPSTGSFTPVFPRGRRGKSSAPSFSVVIGGSFPRARALS